MKNWIKQRGILLLLVLLGIGAAIGVLAARVGVEEDNKTYDILMDYSSLEEMVKASEEDIDFWLGYFRELGIEKLAMQEENILSLIDLNRGKLWARTPGSVFGQYGWQEHYPEEVQQMLLESEYEDDVLVTCEDPELFAWILEAFESRSDVELQVYTAENGDGFLFLAGDGKDISGNTLIEMPLGLDPEKKAQAEKYGYTLVARTLSVEGLNGEAFAEGVLEDYAELGMPYFISGGDGVPGYDDGEKAYPRLLEYLQSNNMTLGMVETSQQSKNLVGGGLGGLIEASGYSAVRVFSMWEYVQWRFGWYNYDGPQEITNCLYRAAYERNCRLIYLKMMLEEQADGTTEYVTDPEQYAILLGDFMDRMDQRGFTMETLTPAENITVGYGSVVLIALGAVAAAILLLSLVIALNTKWTYLLTLLGCIGAAGVLYIMPNTGRLILSIGGGIVMPLLALVALDEVLERTGRKNAALECGLAILGVAAVSLVGGLFASAPLSDSAYMLEMELYRGVKVMQLIPLAGFALFVVKKFCETPCRKVLALPRGEKRAAVQRVLDIPVKIRTLVWIVLAAVVVAIVAAVGSYYLARTGHTEDVGVADLELQIRNFLELHLAARPRTKEFLIGYPCVMLYVWSRRKGGVVMEVLAAFFGLGAMIGATSIVNTFLHIRTAFMLSLIRVGTGFVAGLVIGLIAVALAEAIYRSLKKRLCHV